MTDEDLVPDQIALAELGEAVRTRLAAHPAAYKVDTKELELFAIGGFLSEEECRKLCEMIDAVAQPSRLHEVDYDSGYRTSYSGDLDPRDPLVAEVTRRIDEVLGLNGEFGENLQGQRYTQGQEFKPHNDWFYTSEGYWPQENARGGQRSWTAMVYLNNVEAGGATSFVRAGISVTPMLGGLLLWNNALPDGRPNEGTIHAGVPVERGTKYVVTRWYRTRKWH